MAAIEGAKCLSFHTELFDPCQSLSWVLQCSARLHTHSKQTRQPTRAKQGEYQCIRKTSTEINEPAVTSFLTTLNLDFQLFTSYSS